MSRFRRQAAAFALIVAASAGLYFSAQEGFAILGAVLLVLIGVGMLMAIWTQ